MGQTRGFSIFYHFRGRGIYKNKCVCIQKFKEIKLVSPTLEK